MRSPEDDGLALLLRAAATAAVYRLFSAELPLAFRMFPDPSWQACSPCGGRGEMRSRMGMAVCPVCGGSGEARR